MDTLSALREACLMSPRQGEWSTLPEVNAAQTFDSALPITHTQLSKLVKSDVAESAFIEGQTMYRTSGQAIKEYSGGEGRPPYKPPEGDYPGDQEYPDTRGGKPEDGGKDDWWDYDQPRRGEGEQTPTGAPAPGGISVPIPMPDVSQMM